MVGMELKTSTGYKIIKGWLASKKFPGLFQMKTDADLSSTLKSLQFILLNLKMLTREKILETLRYNKSYFEKELGVISLGLFGSYAREVQHGESDVDILVELRPPLADHYFNLWSKLEKTFNLKVDLLRKGEHLSEKFLKTIGREIIYA